MSRVTEQKIQSSGNFRFSGHETFPCRYTWLPKAVRGLTENAELFADEDAAMVALGVGKNMVRAIRFWVDASEVASTRQKHQGMEVSEFGNVIFGTRGRDQFLENLQTLWLVHWKISTNANQPLFAWHHLLNYWHRPDFSRSEVLVAFSQEAQRCGKSLSMVTLDHHFTTFLHTYVPTRGKKGEVQEDNLDCPLTELELIQKVGERVQADSNRREDIYAFRVEEKPEISQELFIYCLDDYWLKAHKNEKTLNFREVAVGVGSPGQVFKLPEHAVRERLESIEKASRGLPT
ncbi:MAG TPA: DUF4007 family protein [Verrucomicrobiae bacterium]|nr:DUF4007 family protein [Verrucomicrobiae bacterium]